MNNSIFSPCCAFSADIEVPRPNNRQGRDKSTVSKVRIVMCTDMQVLSTHYYLVSVGYSQLVIKIAMKVLFHKLADVFCHFNYDGNIEIYSLPQNKRIQKIIHQDLLKICNVCTIKNTKKMPNKDLLDKLGHTVL